jgi:hypothetical protein
MYLIRTWANLFNYQVNHSSQIAVLRLKQLCDGKKDFSSLRLREHTENASNSMMSAQCTKNATHLSK